MIPWKLWCRNRTIQKVTKRVPSICYVVFQNIVVVLFQNIFIPLCDEPRKHSRISPLSNMSYLVADSSSSNSFLMNWSRRNRSMSICDVLWKKTKQRSLSIQDQRWTMMASGVSVVWMDRNHSSGSLKVRMILADGNASWICSQYRMDGTSHTATQ